MAICSHPLATREAVKILRRGGNACDAALCASITQTVIEPHMTGITGVFAMLYFDAATGETTCVDAGWAAPKKQIKDAVQEDMVTGRAVAVPGDTPPSPDSGDSADAANSADSAQALGEDQEQTVYQSRWADDTSCVN